MDPSKHIVPSHALPRMKSGEKRQAIEELLQLLVDRGDVPVASREEILREILDRESKGSTGIGFEIAIPHAKTDLVSELTVAIGTHSEGIAFDSIDKNSVRIIVLTLSPKRVSGPHLQFMATICNVLKDPAIRARLLAAETPEAVSAVFQAGS